MGTDANALGGVLDGSVRFKEAFKRQNYKAGCYYRKRSSLPIQ